LINSHFILHICCLYRHGKISNSNPIDYLLFIQNGCGEGFADLKLYTFVKQNKMYIDNRIACFLALMAAVHSVCL